MNSANFDPKATLDEATPLGFTPLMYAARNGGEDLVIFLIDQGCDVHKVGPQGWTALHFCAASGHRDAIKRLLSLGMDDQQKTRDGKSALDLAAAFENEKEKLRIWMDGWSAR